MSEQESIYQPARWGPWPDMVTCPACGGLGQVREPLNYGPRYQWVSCDLCGGDGVVWPATAEAWQPAPAEDLEERDDRDRLLVAAAALGLGNGAALEAYARAELRRLEGRPSACWRCKAEVGEGAEACPVCGAELVPF